MPLCSSCKQEVLWKAAKLLTNSDGISCPSCKTGLTFSASAIALTLLIEVIAMSVLAYFLREGLNGYGMFIMATLFVIYLIGRQPVVVAMAYGISAVCSLPLVCASFEKKPQQPPPQKGAKLSNWVCGSCRQALPIEVSKMFLYRASVSCPYCGKNLVLTRHAKLFGALSGGFYCVVFIYLVNMLFVIYLGEINGAWSWLIWPIMFILLTGELSQKYVNRFFCYVASRLPFELTKVKS